MEHLIPNSREYIYIYLYLYIYIYVCIVITVYNEMSNL